MAEGTPRANGDDTHDPQSPGTGHQSQRADPRIVSVLPSLDAGTLSLILLRKAASTSSPGGASNSGAALLALTLLVRSSDAAALPASEKEHAPTVRLIGI